MPPDRAVRSGAPSPTPSGVAPASPGSEMLAGTSSVPDANFDDAELASLGSTTISGVSIELFAYHDEPHNQSLVAVYHNDYRSVWIAEYDTSIYAHPRAQGPMTNDITCFYAPHQQWGPAREDWPDILYQIYPRQQIRNYRKPDWLFTGEGWLVLDYRGKPVFNFAMPLCLSSVVEDWVLETIMRENHHVNIGVQDIQARLPGAISKDGTEPSRCGTVSMRMQRFRKIAGCISWAPKSGSDGLATYMASILPDECKQANSTRGFRNLWPYERAEMELQNMGKYPRKARVGRKDLSERKRHGMIVRAYNKYMHLKQKHEAEYRTSVPTGQTLQDYLDAAGLSHYNDSDTATATDPATGLATGIATRRAPATVFQPGRPTRPSTILQNAYPSSSTHTAPPSTAPRHDYLSSKPLQVHHMDLNNLFLGPARWHFQNLTWIQPPETDLTASYNERYQHLQNQLAAHFAANAIEREVPALIGVTHFDANGLTCWNLPWDNDMFGAQPDLESMMDLATREYGI